MTNKEIFMMVFGKNPENLKQKASTIDWWDQEFIGPPDCDDAISRKAALDLVSDYDLTMGQVVNGVHALPPVTPQPKIGRWIRWYEIKDYGWYVDHMPHCKCSECGKEYDPHSSKFIKYCNVCGFGIQLESRPHRFDRLKERNPKYWEFLMYRCVTDETGTYGWGRILDYLGIEWENEIGQIRGQMNIFDFIGGGAS